MLFLTDENIPKLVVKELRLLGHKVKDVKEAKLFGISDRTVSEIARREKRIIITLDKDFLNLSRSLVFGHKGIIVLRLSNQQPKNIVEKLLPLLKLFNKRKLSKSITIVSDKHIEVIKS